MVNMDNNIYKIYSTTPEHIHCWLGKLEIEHCLPYDAEYIILIDTSKIEDEEISCCVIDKQTKEIIFQYFIGGIEKSIRNWFLEEIKNKLK